MIVMQITIFKTVTLSNVYSHNNSIANLNKRFANDSCKSIYGITYIHCNSQNVKCDKCNPWQ